MGFHCSTPVAPLGDLIEKIWDWDMPVAAHRFERVLPQPGAVLIINLHEDETRVYADDVARECTRSSACVLGGPSSRSQIIDTAEQVRVMGVVFRQGGVHAFTGEDVTRLAERDTDLLELFGAGADGLRQRLLDTPAPAQRLALLEAWLHRRARMTPVHAAVHHAVSMLDRVPQLASIPLIARATGLSERRLLQLFRRQVGMTPKHYARLMRFRAVVQHAHAHATVDWSAVAADCGFSDQAHLSHEFRRFAGLSPSAFMARRGPHPNHLPLD